MSAGYEFNVGWAVDNSFLILGGLNASQFIGGAAKQGIIFDGQTV